MPNCLRHNVSFSIKVLCDNVSVNNVSFHKVSFNKDVIDKI